MNYDIIYARCQKEFDHLESTFLQNILFLLHVDEEVPVQAVYNVRI